MTNDKGKGGKSHFYTGDIRYSLIEQIDLLSLKKIYNLSLKIFSRKKRLLQSPIIVLSSIYRSFLLNFLFKCGKLIFIIIFPSSYIDGLF